MGAVPPGGERVLPAVLIFILILAAAPLHAQEIHLLGGLGDNTATSHGTYAWQIGYLEGLGEHLAFSVSYLNEGHVPIHHRDGNTLQLWGRFTLLDRRLSLAAGAGPYYYFDTTAASASGDCIDNHGWGTMFSTAVTWYADNHWLVLLKSNWVHTGDSIDTTSMLLGIGYRFSPPPPPGPPGETPPPAGQDNELTAFLGRTIVNSFNSEKAVATAVEYRRNVVRHLDWTVGWLHEGDARLIRRNGVTSQLWAVEPLLDDSLLLGIGGGAYIAIDRYIHTLPGESGSKPLSGLLTLTADYRFTPRWSIRTSWNRVVTSYNRDTDVILGGLGFRF